MHDLVVRRNMDKYQIRMISDIRRDFFHLFQTCGTADGFHWAPLHPCPSNFWGEEETSLKSGSRWALPLLSERVNFESSYQSTQDWGLFWDSSINLKPNTPLLLHQCPCVSHLTVVTHLFLTFLVRLRHWMCWNQLLLCVSWSITEISPILPAAGGYSVTKLVDSVPKVGSDFEGLDIIFTFGAFAIPSFFAVNAFTVSWVRT